MYLVISKDPSVKGININGLYKISQYADNITLILDGSSSSLSAALRTVKFFGSMSGLKINTDKTNLIWIGSKQNSTDKLPVGKKIA